MGKGWASRRLLGAVCSLAAPHLEHAGSGRAVPLRGSGSPRAGCGGGGSVRPGLACGRPGRAFRHSIVAAYRGGKPERRRGVRAGPGRWMRGKLWGRFAAVTAGRSAGDEEGGSASAEQPPGAEAGTAPTGPPGAAEKRDVLPRSARRGARGRGRGPGGPQLPPPRARGKEILTEVYI